MKRQPDEQPYLWIIIEDEPGYRRLLDLIIERFYQRETLHLAGGSEAMQWVEDFREGRYNGPMPEIIISGYDMGSPHGLDVYRELRKTPGLSEMPIVIASTPPFHPYEMKEGDHFISKPFLPDELKAIIDEVLEAGRGKDSGQ